LCFWAVHGLGSSLTRQPPAADGDRAGDGDRVAHSDLGAIRRGAESRFQVLVAWDHPADAEQLGLVLFRLGRHLPVQGHDSVDGIDMEVLVLLSGSSVWTQSDSSFVTLPRGTIAANSQNSHPAHSSSVT